MRAVTPDDRYRIRRGLIPHAWSHNDPSEGVQGGLHVCTVTERRPRHVHYTDLWPDGVLTSGSGWLNDVRRQLRDADLVEIDWGSVAPEVTRARG